jgi:hypothetical protein
MSSKTNWMENLCLDAFIRDDAAALATIAAMELELALFKSALSETTGLASGANEVTGSGYTRISNASLVSAFSSAAASGSVSNVGALSWGPFSSAPGTIYAVGFVDGTSGQVAYYYNLASPVTPSTGSILRYAAGQLTLVES